MKKFFVIISIILCAVCFDTSANANIFESIKDKVADVAESVSDKASDIKESVEDKIDEYKEEHDNNDDDNDEDDDKDEDSDDNDADDSDENDDNDDSDEDDSDNDNNDDKDDKKNDKKSKSDKSNSGSDGVADTDKKSADSAKKLQDLKDNAQKMKDKEQSTANKLLGGAAIGAVGIGGMNIASAMSEQSADDEAERSMRAYLATFACDYGTGRNIKGGETGIELPGANDLTPMVAEYRALAADIAARKAALGMPAGIEAEVIFDKSETGLYDNVGIGAQPGAFTSLARALSDEDSADAKAWQEQKDATSKKLKTGAIVAGIGVVGSIAGNLIINSKNKNESDKLLAEYQALKKLESEINKLPKEGKICRCYSNQICNENTGDCENCPGNKIVVNNKCDCPDNTTEQSDGRCVAKRPDVVWTCKPDSSKHIVVDNMNLGTCRCVDGFIADNPSQPTSCTCPSDTHEEKVQGDTVQCIVKTSVPNNNVVVPQPVNLDASSLFDTGRYTIKSAAAAKISEFAGSVKAQNKDKYCIRIVGNTDKTGSDKINIPLSKNRAIAVAKHLVNTNGLGATHVCATGQGSINCKLEGNQESCRNVQMSYSSDNDCKSTDCLPLNYVAER